jgi:hypothetical protein
MKSASLPPLPLAQRCRALFSRGPGVSRWHGIGMPRDEWIFKGVLYSRCRVGWLAQPGPISHADRPNSLRIDGREIGSKG